MLAVVVVFVWLAVLAVFHCYIFRLHLYRLAAAVSALSRHYSVLCKFAQVRFKIHDAYKSCCSELCPVFWHAILCNAIPENDLPVLVQITVS